MIDTITKVTELMEKHFNSGNPTATEKLIKDALSAEEVLIYFRPVTDESREQAIVVLHLISDGIPSAFQFTFLRTSGEDDDLFWDIVGFIELKVHS